MKSLGRLVINFIGTFFILLLVLISISFVNHRISLTQEAKSLSPWGHMVLVNGHSMHIYSEGRGEHTLVFLSGGGTSSPLLDFKSLYSLLSDRYKIAVIEKSGYGFSEDATISRDIDTILYESRKALLLAALEPPYLLVPHSMSGIEALYWAQKHPEEVEGIIGLDMAVPRAYEDYWPNFFLLKFSSFGARIGITRLFPSLANDSAAIKYEKLKEEEKDIYRSLFYKGTLTKSMFREIESIKTNAQKVGQAEIAHVPMLLFISSGEGTGWTQDQWMDYQSSFIHLVKEAKSIKLAASHYIHNIQPLKISKEIKEFIEEVINK